jgi:hypothetical protein
MFGGGKRKRLDKHGKRANATVLEISDTGPTVRGGSFFGDQEVEQVRKSKLRVEPEGEPPFEVSGRFKYPNRAVPVAGGQIPVTYDPDDHDTLMIGPIAAKTEAELGADLAGTPLGSGLAGDEKTREEMLEEAKKWMDAYPDSKK